jgi:cyanophycinase
MRITRRAALSAALIMLVTFGASPATAQPLGNRQGGDRQPGALILVGGALADGNAEIYQEIVRLAGGPGKARIGVLTAAAVTPSEDPDAGTPDCNNSVCNGDYYTALLRSYGVADAQWIPIDIERAAAAHDPAVVAQVNTMTGFFFGGGDQIRYVNTLLGGEAGVDTPVMAAIRAKFRAGAVVAGTSAGAQIQAGADMITGGSTHHALRDGSAEGYFEDADKLGYWSDGGFGFISSGLLDTHFSRRGREGRSIRLAADTGHRWVYGIDENTALKVTGAGTPLERLTVLGERGVGIFDLRAAITDTYQGQWRIRNVRWSYLTRGDEFYPLVHVARFAGDKQRVQPASTCQLTPSDDIFYNYALVKLTVGLADNGGCASVSGTSYEDDPLFAATVTRGWGWRAARAGASTSFVDARITINVA